MSSPHCTLVLDTSVHTRIKISVELHIHTYVCMYIHLNNTQSKQLSLSSKIGYCLYGYYVEWLQKMFESRTIFAPNFGRATTTTSVLFTSHRYRTFGPVVPKNIPARWKMVTGLPVHWMHSLSVVQELKHRAVDDSEIYGIRTFNAISISRFVPYHRSTEIHQL